MENTPIKSPSDKWGSCVYSLHDVDYYSREEFVNAYKKTMRWYTASYLSLSMHADEAANKIESEFRARHNPVWGNATPKAVAELLDS